jgi:xanthine dehydrogenase accessory factor
MNELLAKNETFAVATIVNYKGSVPRRLAKMLITKDLKTYGSIGGGCVEGQIAEEAAILLKEGATGVVVKSYDLVEEEFGGIGMNCGGRIDVSIEIVEPTPQIIIAGSGHLSSALAKLSHQLGFDVVVIDPLAKKENFPGTKMVLSDFVENNLPNLQLPTNSCIVIVTRHKDDLPALRTSLKTKAEYIGMIGSRRRVLQAFRLLKQEGYSDAQLARVNAPIGLDIGAETPEEIAVSIMAEIIQHRRIGRNEAAQPMKIDAPTLQGLQAEANSRN